MAPSPTGSFEVRKVASGNVSDVNDMLAVEEPLEIRLKTDKEKPVSITMRTPGNDKELAAGFLFTEGIVKSQQDIQQIHRSPFDENVITAELKTGTEPDFNRLERNFYTTSSCGVCGKSSLDAVRSLSAYGISPDTFVVPAALLQSLQGKLKNRQQVFEQTGGLHCSALFDTNGNLLILREDVGRHNALDKVIGAMLRENKLPLRNTLLLLSGRISFELVQKAMMAGIPFVAAIGAPSTLAVGLAEENNMTLVGFLKSNQFTIYTGKHRVS